MNKKYIFKSHPELVSGSQSGRSMVEMLGVLAVIGVLSVAGIAGYSMAMKKHQANVIIDGLQKRAVAIAAVQNLRGIEAEDFLEYEGEDLLGLSMFLADSDVGDFAIEIDGVEKSLCEQIKSMGMASAISIEPENCGDTNDMYFNFNNDLIGSNTSSGRISACPAGSTTNEDGKTCDKDGKKVCTDNSNCQKNQYCKVGIIGMTHADDCSIGSGECKDLGSSNSYDGFIWSVTEAMNWFSAQNWCKAKRATLADETTIEKKVNGNPDQTYFYTGIQHYITHNTSYSFSGAYWLQPTGSHYSCIGYKTSGDMRSAEEINKEYHVLCKQ